MRQLWARERLRVYIKFLLSQIVPNGTWNDWANLPVVVEAASQQTRIGLVLADAEFEFISVKL
jgi:hypothetical protein